MVGLRVGCCESAFCHRLDRGTFCSIRCVRFIRGQYPSCHFRRNAVSPNRYAAFDAWKAPCLPHMALSSRPARSGSRDCGGPRGLRWGPCAETPAPAEKIGRALRLPRPYQPSPIRRSGRPAQRPFHLFEACSAFTRVAACPLALLPIRDTLIEGFSHFVTSMTAPIASGWSESPGGPRTHWRAPPCHRAPPQRTVSGQNGGQFKGAHASSIIPPRKIAPKCDLPHIPSKLPPRMFSLPRPWWATGGSTVLLDASTYDETGR
jgi:hypothetical protein